MSQTVYNTNMAKGYAGQLADDSDHRVVSLLNGEASTALPFGIAVAKGASDSECLLPAASTDKLLGLTVRDSSIQSASVSSNGAIIADAMASVLTEGTMYVLPEQTVAKGDPVFVRYTAGAGALKVGRLRKDADGTAQVNTLTPTAVNSTIYNLAVSGYAYAATSDGSATATEIVTAFKDLVNAQSALHGVVATGTTTLILTASVAGAPFTTSFGANWAEVATQANVAKAARFPGAEWDEAGAADAPTKLSLNLPA